MELTRQQLLQAHQQVLNATDSLVRAFNLRTATPSRIRELVKKGAMTSKVLIGDWRKAIESPDPELLCALLDGADGMNQEQRCDRIRMALSQDSAQSARQLFDRGWFGDLTHRNIDFLKDAIGSGCLDNVDLMIEAGADLGFADGPSGWAITALHFAQTPEMFTHLVGKGCTPTASAMSKSAIGHDTPPNPRLLEAFLAAGSPTEVSNGVMCWHALLSNQDRPPEQHDAVVECARLLLQAGAARKVGAVYPLTSLLAALDAGMPAAEAEATLVNLWGMQTFPSHEFLSKEKGFQSTNDRIREVLPVLLKIEAAGANIDLFEKIGPCKGSEVGLLFHLAGVDTGLKDTWSVADNSTALANRLHRQTPRQMASKPARRI